MNRKRPLSEIQPSTSQSPRSSSRLEKKSKTQVEPENNNYNVPNTYRKIERDLSMVGGGSVQCLVVDAVIASVKTHSSPGLI